MRQRLRVLIYPCRFSCFSCRKNIVNASQWPSAFSFLHHPLQSGLQLCVFYMSLASWTFTRHYTWAGRNTTMAVFAPGEWAQTGSCSCSPRCENTSVQEWPLTPRAHSTCHKCKVKCSNVDFFDRRASYRVMSHTCNKIAAPTWPVPAAPQRCKIFLSCSRT